MTLTLTLIADGLGLLCWEEAEPDEGCRITTQEKISLIMGLNYG